MKTPIKTITEEESTLLLSGLLYQPSTPAGQRRMVRNTCLVLVMLDAGLRVGETVQLLRSDLWYGVIPHANLVVRAEIAKTHIERIIPITERLKQSIYNLQRYVWSEDTDTHGALAFYISHGPRPLSIRQVQRTVEHASKLGMHRMIHPHVLRHTFATRIMKQSDSRVVQQLLGHSSLTSTQIYTHPDQEDRKKAITAMEQNTNDKTTSEKKDAGSDLEATS